MGLDLEIGVYPNGIAIKLLSHPDKPTWNSKLTIEPAQKRALDNDGLVQGFQETGNPIYKLGKLTSKIKGQLFLPAGTLKREKRAFWEWAAEQLSAVKQETREVSLLKEFLVEYENSKPADASQEKICAEVTHKGEQPKKKGTLIVKSVFACNQKTDEVSLPHFCREDRLEELERRIQEAYDIGIRRFRLTSMFQIPMLAKYDDIVKVSAYPFPVLNSLATRELKDYGISRVQAWLELEGDQFREFISRSQLPVELYRYGRPFLYATRADVHVEGHVSDNRGVAFTVENNKNMGINYIYPIEVLSIPKMENTVDFFDLSHCRWNEEKTTEFNLNHVLK